VSLGTAVVIALITYELTIRAERERQLIIGRRVEQLHNASVASVTVANEVSASLGAADHVIRTLTFNGSAEELEAGRKRWNAADSIWATEKIGLSQVIDFAGQNEEINAAWSHMDSTVFRLGEDMTSVFVNRQPHGSMSQRAVATILTARRDSAQAALQQFLGLMRTELAVR
jgi:hypothetical protein